MNEPRVRTILEVFCGLLTEELARVAGISRVCGEQQSSLGNEGITLYGKLWERVKDGRQYKKKRKDGEGDRICRKNEEST